jgi:hypothetical protein
MFPDAQRAMLDRVLAAVRDDPRIEAMLGTGSLVTGGFDAHSDLDLVLIEAVPVADRRAFAEGLGTLLTAFTGEHVGAPDLLICLYGGPLLHVDLRFAPRERLARFAERPAVLWARDPAGVEHWLTGVPVQPVTRDAQWFEDRAWPWLHYAATKWARGEYFVAIGSLDFFRHMVLAPMLQRAAGQPLRGQRRIEALPGARERLLPILAGYDAGEIRRALVNAVDAYVDLRAADPPLRLTPQMPQALLDFLQ